MMHRNLKRVKKHRITELTQYTVLGKEQTK